MHQAANRLMHRVSARSLFCLCLMAVVAGAFLAFKPRPALDTARIHTIEILCPHKHRTIIAKLAEDEVNNLSRWVDRHGKDRQVMGSSFAVVVTDLNGNRFAGQVFVDPGFRAFSISPNRSFTESLFGRDPEYFSFRHSSGVIYDKLESLRKTVSNCAD
jgi:hypothetical protein